MNPMFLAWATRTEMAKAVSEIFWGEFQEFSLNCVVCEMSIKHPSRYIKLTVGYISLSKTQGDFINNCQYFSTALYNSCVVILFFFSGDLWKYFQSTSVALVPGSIYQNPRNLKITFFMFPHLNDNLSIYQFLWSAKLFLHMTFFMHSYLWLFLDCFSSLQM